LNRDYQRTGLFIVLTLCGVVLAGFSLYYSWTLRQRLIGLGFTDVTNFRNYIYFLNPIGLPIGVWSTVFFPLLCFPVILVVKFRHSRLAKLLLCQPISMILVAMISTFIRGVYIGLAASLVLLFILTLVYRVFPVRTVMRAGLILPLLVIPGLVPIVRPVMTTLSLFSTTSQVRSFNGRTKLWADSSQMVKDHLWLGVGSGNFVMKHLAYRSTDDDAAFVLRPFNALLQITAEKGVIGLLAYGFLAASFLWVSHRKILTLRYSVYEQFVVLVFVTAFIGMLVRDMSESSMLVNGGVGLMLTYMFAHNAHASEL
jgi:O-antigen ligase